MVYFLYSQYAHAYHTPFLYETIFHTISFCFLFPIMIVAFYLDINRIH